MCLAEHKARSVVKTKTRRTTSTTELHPMPWWHVEFSKRLKLAQGTQLENNTRECSAKCQNADFGLEATGVAGSECLGQTSERKRALMRSLPPGAPAAKLQKGGNMEP